MPFLQRKGKEKSTFIFDDVLKLLRFVGKVERVRHAVTAARLNAQTKVLFAAFCLQLPQSPRCRICLSHAGNRSRNDQRVFSETEHAAPASERACARAADICSRSRAATYQRQDAFLFHALSQRIRHYPHRSGTRKPTTQHYFFENMCDC